MWRRKLNCPLNRFLIPTHFISLCFINHTHTHTHTHKTYWFSMSTKSDIMDNCYPIVHFVRLDISSVVTQLSCSSRRTLSRIVTQLSCSSRRTLSRIVTQLSFSSRQTLSRIVTQLSISSFVSALCPSAQLSSDHAFCFISC